MKRAVFITFLFISLSGIGDYGIAVAQSQQNTIFDALGKQPKQNEGVVVIHQSDAIKRLVGTRKDGENIDATSGKSTIKTMGYRIQVYSGNNQRTSKDETFALEKKIKEMYKGIETYPDFDAPFWKLHLGNYLTFEEASVMVRELQKAFPQQRKEIYVIEATIQLMLD